MNFVLCLTQFFFFFAKWNSLKLLRLTDCSQTLFFSACLRGERQQFQKRATEALQRYDFRFHIFAI